MAISIISLRMQNKKNYQRQRRTLYNGKRVNLSKRHHNLKIYTTNNRASEYMQAKTGKNDGKDS